MSKVYFKETQRYKSKATPIVLAVIGLIAAIEAFYFILVARTNIGAGVFLAFVALSIGVLIWLLTRLKLKVVITEKAVKFKMWPIHVKKQTILWSDIGRCEVIKTSEVAQWCGGNITFNREKRYSFNGRNGLAIKTMKGETFFLGCRKINELQHALEEMEIE